LRISIRTEKSQEVLVVVYDELGRQSYSKVVFTDDNSENTFAIDPSAKLKPGIYMVTGISEKNTFVKRLIVK
jgi:phosphoglycolate phosphatase-like HAD superfamily hydrolase